LNEEGTATLERRCVAAVRFDGSFYACLQRDDFREQLRRILIARYFLDASERAALYSLVGVPVPPEDVVKADALLYEKAQEKVREARFRLTVVPAYDYTCALTGYRLVTARGGSIVDAAHIHQFADSRNNHPRNGIALCKNAHWLFDEGVWSLTDDYKVIVAIKRFHESGSDELLLSRMAGKAVHLPSDKRYWPDLAHLKWHREHKLGDGHPQD
jgi:putative restriction endonuclease